MNRRGFIQQTRVERDRDGRVTADVRDGLRTEYAYDRAGQLTGAVTSEGTRTSYEWDAGERLVAETCDGQVTRHGYDRAGQLVWTRCPDGTRLTYDYDPSGRRVRETGPDRERLFDWDPRGFLTQVTRVSRHGDQVRARRTRLHVDAGGLLAAAGDQPVHWDTAAAWPALAQIGAVTETALYDGGRRLARARPDRRPNRHRRPRRHRPHHPDGRRGHDLPRARHRRARRPGPRPAGRPRSPPEQALGTSPHRRRPGRARSPRTRRHD